MVYKPPYEEEVETLIKKYRDLYCHLVPKSHFMWIKLEEELKTEFLPKVRGM